MAVESTCGGAIPCRRIFSMASDLTTTGPNVRTLLEDGNARASAVLTGGSILWKVLAYAEHIDFFLSFKEFSMIFDFFESAGLVDARGCWDSLVHGNAREGKRICSAASKLGFSLIMRLNGLRLWLANNREILRTSSHGHCRLGRKRHSMQCRRGHHAALVFQRRPQDCSGMRDRKSNYRQDGR
jgi:hypothetical protein